jgi:hypothetical protein
MRFQAMGQLKSHGSTAFTTCAQPPTLRAIRSEMNERLMSMRLWMASSMAVL